MRLTEHQEQALLIKYLRLRDKEVASSIFSIPNGAHLAGNPLQRAKKMSALKAEGLLTGAADLMLMMARGGYHGLFIEMKRTKYVPSDVKPGQLDFQARAIKNGYKSVICGGFDEAREQIRLYLALDNQ